VGQVARRRDGPGRARSSLRPRLHRRGGRGLRPRHGAVPDQGARGARPLPLRAHERDADLRQPRRAGRQRVPDLRLGQGSQDPPLCHTTNSFPGQFLTTIELKRTTFGHRFRFDGHQKLEILVFKKPGLAETWQWRSHFITEKCTACTICERVCPTNAISGGERFFIDPDLCINCSVCGIYCPFDAITNDRDTLVTHIKPKQVPKALVHEELCTGCEFCVDVCPFEALEMKLDVDGFNRIATVIEKNCTSCKLCEQVCIKDAIEIPRVQNFRDIGMSFMSYLSDGH